MSNRDGQDAVFPDDRIIALEHSLAALETQQQTLLILAEAQRQQLSSLKKDFEIQVTQADFLRMHAEAAQLPRDLRASRPAAPPATYLGEFVEFKYGPSNRELLYGFIRPLERLPADASAKLHHLGVFVNRRGIVDAGPILKVGARVRFKISEDRDGVLASDIAADCDGTYEMGPAAAATGPTVITRGPA